MSEQKVWERERKVVIVCPGCGTVHPREIRTCMLCAGEKGQRFRTLACRTKKSLERIQGRAPISLKTLETSSD